VLLRWRWGGGLLDLGGRRATRDAEDFVVGLGGRGELRAAMKLTPRKRLAREVAVGGWVVETLERCEGAEGGRGRGEGKVGMHHSFRGAGGSHLERGEWAIEVRKWR
jgi:hypothetical protein